jgi:hypothetical protein
MEDNKIFDDILDDGEKIVAVVRPNKKKFWAFFNWLFFWVWSSWLIPTIAIMAVAFWFDKDIKPHRVLAVNLTVWIGVASIILPYIVCVFLCKTTLKKRYYAYSNKRILIRCGIIGVNYKVLDYKLLGATTADVGVLDKIMGAKTGWLRFGSASAPIVNALGSSGLGLGGFTFSHIDKPYELLREIKRTINANTEKQ